MRLSDLALAAQAYKNHHRQKVHIITQLHFRSERSPFQRGAKNTGERKFPFIFSPGSESSRERKLAGAKIPRVFAPGSESKERVGDVYSALYINAPTDW